MIKYDLGLGRVCLSVGRQAVDDNVCIDIERLLHSKPIGELQEGEEYQTLDGVRLIIHNKKGLKQLKKMIKIAEKELENDRSS